MSSNLHGKRRKRGLGNLNFSQGGVRLWLYKKSKRNFNLSTNVNDLKADVYIKHNTTLEPKTCIQCDTIKL